MLFGDRGRAGIEAIKRGDWETAMSQAALDWAAVPGSTLHKKIAPKKKRIFINILVKILQFNRNRIYHLRTLHK